MGNVYINEELIGTFSPQELDASGVVYINSDNIGTFDFVTPTGYVYLNSEEIGTYELPEIPPPPPMVAPLELGVQWGVRVWSVRQQKWLKGGI